MITIENISEIILARVASVMAIYRMGNQSGAKIRGEWERKWSRMAPGLKRPNFLLHVWGIAREQTLTARSNRCAQNYRIQAPV